LSDIFHTKININEIGSMIS